MNYPIVLKKSLNGDYSLFVDMLTDDDVVEITATIYELLDNYFDEFIIQMCEPHFPKTLIYQVMDIFIDDWQEIHSFEDDDKEELYTFVENILNDYLLLREEWNSVIPYRSQKKDKLFSFDLKEVTNKIDYLRSVIQPEQRTKEWYTFRHELITASNLWKIFGTDAQYNSLIYEKCLPLKVDQDNTNSSVNILSPLHWGQKYEPLSVMVYEEKYNTKIEDFGCIQHNSYKFIGASPDGINVDKTNNKYGRMLEIKNIVNREIDGIPSKAYWIQMQMQMETCNLDTCDFLETRFKEYENEEQFYDEKREIKRGIILHFVERLSIGGGFQNTSEENEEAIENDETNGGYILAQQYSGKPNYVYMPLDCSLQKDDVEKWIDETRTKMRRSWSLYSVIYWYLDEYSCVLVERSKLWFQAAIPKIKDTWDIIVKERKDGYEHRAAKKKVPKQELKVIHGAENNRIITNLPKTGGICLVKLDNEDKTS